MNKIERAIRAKYTLIKSFPGNHIVFLKIGVQSFIVGVPVNTQAEANWFRRQLVKALATLIAENH